MVSAECIWVYGAELGSAVDRGFSGLVARKPGLSRGGVGGSPELVLLTVGGLD